MSLLNSLKVENRKRLLVRLSVVAVGLLICIGVMAKNGWFPSDANGKRTGWFGKPLAKNAPSAWNPLAMPSPTPTPQLAREFIYAGQGSRLLAVEDKNATAAPPADLAIWRPSNGTWYIQTNWETASWGQTGDEPIPGDFDGDGKTDFSVIRPGTGTCPCTSTWYIFYSASGPGSFTYAQNGDLPAQADYDGDGKTDPAIFRPSTGFWHIQGTSVGYYTQEWGTNGDIPAPADYDGDGKADLGVFRPSNRWFYSRNSADNSLQYIDSGISSGTYEWLTVSGDYDGDGKADYAVYDKDTATWYVRTSTTGTFNDPFDWGDNEDRPVQNDYDADGKVDYAVWTNSGTHEGRWHIRNSSDASTRDVNWGQTSDVPVPAFYRR